MGFFKRLFGICQTPLPADPGCWKYVDGIVEITLDRAPELAEPGGAVRLEGSGLPHRVLVVHGEGGSFHAFPNRCTHVGHRRFDSVPGEARIRCCSVGQSTFDYDGNNLSGSATKPIQPLNIESRPGELIISLD